MKRGTMDFLAGHERVVVAVPPGAAEIVRYEPRNPTGKSHSRPQTERRRGQSKMAVVSRSVALAAALFLGVLLVFLLWGKIAAAQ